MAWFPDEQYNSRNRGFFFDYPGNGFYGGQSDDFFVLNSHDFGTQDPFTIGTHSYDFPTGGGYYPHLSDSGFVAPDPAQWNAVKPTRQTWPIQGRDQYLSDNTAASSPTTDFDLMLNNMGSWATTTGSESVASTVPSSPSISSKPKDRQHACWQCGAWYSKAESLDFHAKQTGHRSHICHCGKKYNRRDVFLRHKALHRASGVRHTCRFCPVGRQPVFKRKDHLAQHLWNKHKTESESLDCNGAVARDLVLAQGVPVVPEVETKTTNPSTQQSTVIQKVMSALEECLGESHSAVRMINSTPDLESTSSKEELARVFAQLALIEPGLLSAETKEKLKDVADM